MTANEAKTRMNDVNAVCAPEVCPAADSRFAFTYAVRYFAYCIFYYFYYFFESINPQRTQAVN